MASNRTWERSNVSIVYADRFVLKAGSGVRGVWDAEELRRALWNLAINAVKYGDREKPITISVQRSGSGAQISVHNYGAVIAPDAQAHLFDPFARTREARTSGRGGWGLGLTLARGAAEAHGGLANSRPRNEPPTNAEKLPILHSPFLSSRNIETQTALQLSVAQEEIRQQFRAYGKSVVVVVN
jgi:signal transduction histidine kinase